MNRLIPSKGAGKATTKNFDYLKVSAMNVVKCSSSRACVVYGKKKMDKISSSFLSPN